jgi:3-oxoacyl-[acyl-carrier protein] reductase
MMTDIRTEPDTRTPTFPDLAGKVAVVTGGSRGIGAATCVALGANGARVAVGGRDTNAIAEVVEATRAAGGEAVGVEADCTSPEAQERMRDEAERALGPADIVIAFAGGFTARTPLLESSLEEWRDIIESNLTATFITLKTFAPGMVERGKGSIVTMASNSARFLDIPLTASYAAAKAGIVQLTRHAAKELGPEGVRVNCVAPGTTLTDRVERLMNDETRAQVAALAPLGRLGTPEDSAWATLYLASDAAAYLTGVTIDITGGRIML